MNERLKSIVDLEKYPIYDLNSPTIKNLISFSILASYKKLIEAKKNDCYNAHYENVKHHKKFSNALNRSLNCNKAAVIEIEIDPEQITTRHKLKDLKIL